jgi:transposase-like protein
MSGHGQKISRTQEKAIAALLANTSIPAAARIVGIADSTLSRWLKVDSFQAAYRKARKQVVSLAVTQVQAAMRKDRLR